MTGFNFNQSVVESMESNNSNSLQLPLVAYHPHRYRSYLNRWWYLAHLHNTLDLGTPYLRVERRGVSILLVGGS